MLFLLMLFGLLLKAQPKHILAETPEQKAKRMQWWSDGRFGMFIHWGLYALPARHEWVKNHEKLNNEQYQKYFDNFNRQILTPQKMGERSKGGGHGKIVLPGYSGKIRHAQFLNDDSELTHKESADNKEDLILTLPKSKPPYEVPVVELLLK